MATLTQQRAEDAVTYGYLLVVESLPYAWTDLDGLIDDASYLGAGRTIKGGLKVPGSLRVSADLRGGMLEDDRAVFRIVDTDGHMGSMFAADRGAGSLAVVTQPILASVDPASASYNGPSGAVTVRDRYVGPEYIDASGNRRTRYIVPSASGSPPGWDHLTLDSSDGAPVMVGEDPHVFAGLRVGLHRIVVNRETGAIDAWADQVSSGSLIWQGKLVDRAEVMDMHTWGLECQGFDSWLAGDLNGLNPDQYLKVRAFADLEDGERGIAVMFLRGEIDAGGGFSKYTETEYKGIVWDSSYDFTAGVNDSVSLATTISEAISDAHTGGTTYGNGPNYNTAGATYDTIGDASINTGTRAVSLQINKTVTDFKGLMVLAVHRKVAAALGFDFVLQGDPSLAFSDPIRLEQGGPLAESARLAGKESLRTAGANPLDFDGYVYGLFSTQSPTIETDDDNAGAPRVTLPAYSTGSISISPEGGQIVALAADWLYIQGQKALRPGSGLASVPTTSDGTTMDSVGWLHFRGEVLRGTSNFDGEAEREEVNQVALVNWKDSAGVVDGAQYPEFYIVRWEDPRAFGFENRRITKPLTVGGSTGLEVAIMARLDGYHEGQDTEPGEFWRVVPRVMLSSGTVGAWSGSTPPTSGDNNPAAATGDLYWAGDLEVQQLGLNIEAEAVDFLSWRNAADDLPSQRFGAFSRCVYATVGPMQAADLIRGAHASRGLCMGVSKDSGGRPKYSCFAPWLPITSADVEYTLTDTDLAARPGSPDAWIPDWKSRPFPPVDFFTFNTRDTPTDRGTTYETRRRSIDRGRISRTGQVEYQIEDGGLSNPSLFDAGADLYDWRGDAQGYWARDVGRFLSSRTAMLTTTIKHTNGQFLYPGTAVQITNSFVQELDGTGLGLTAGLGRVVSSEFVLDGDMAGCTRVTILLQEQKAGSGDGGRYWAGCARVSGISNTGGSSYDLTVVADHWGAEHGDSDARAFEEPGNGAYGGTVSLRILQSKDGVTFDNTVLATLVSVDTGTNTVSITVDSGTLYGDMFTILALDDYDTQAANNWPRTLLSVITNNTGTTFGGSSTQGWKLD